MRSLVGHLVLAAQAPLERVPLLPDVLRGNGEGALTAAQTKQVEALLSGAGYAQTRTETLGLDPPVVCVLAVNPGPVPRFR